MITHASKWKDLDLDSFYRNSFLGFRKFLFSRYSIPIHDIEDLYQDSFIILLNKLEDNSLHGIKCSPKTYLYGIGKNLARSYHRSIKKAVLIDPNDNRSNAIFQRVKCEQADTFHNLYTSMNVLLRRKRFQILGLYYMKNMKMQEIAVHLKYKNRDSAKAQKHKAFKKFKIEVLRLHSKGVQTLYA